MEEGFPCRKQDEVFFKGILYPTSEHAFQAMKSLDEEERQEIALLPTPGKAKRAGKKLTLRADWEEVKEEVMHAILVCKFSKPELKEKLLDTCDAVLVEGNSWGDREWGVCDGVGKNKLGKILMLVREKLRG